MGTCHHGMAHPQVADGETASKKCSSSYGVGRSAKTPRHKKLVLLRNRYMCLGPRLIIWNELSIPERKRPLGKLRRRWEDNIKMDLQEVGWGSMDWLDLV